ncbi:MAG: hypothetical protein NT013_09180 [Planctomycetia bacterium]|nr:hypothetical protein [Planctomycetia bacterium]
MTSFCPESDAVNCAVALERLDCVWIDPVPDEPLDADLSAAMEHVRQCSACWTTFEKRRECDARLAMIMQTILVPVGLREQLLARTAEMSVDLNINTDAILKTGNDLPVNGKPLVEKLGHREGTYEAALLRRRAWTITTAAAMLVFAASGSWLWHAMQGRPTSVQTLCELTPLTAEGLPIVQDLSQLPALPQSWPRIKGLKIIGVPCWFQPPGSKTAASWIPFELRQPKSKPIHGVLLTMLRENVLDPPSELMVQSALLKYAHRAGKPLSVAGWSEQGVVYLCFVNDEPAAIERLMKLTMPTAA